MKRTTNESLFSTVRRALLADDSTLAGNSSGALAVSLRELEGRLAQVQRLGGPFAGVEASEHLAALAQAIAPDVFVASSEIQRVAAHRLARDGEHGRHVFPERERVPKRRAAS